MKQIYVIVTDEVYRRLKSGTELPGLAEHERISILAARIIAEKYGNPGIVERHFNVPNYAEVIEDARKNWDGADVLRILRCDFGLTQERITDLLDVSRSHLAMIETGQRVCSINLKAAALALVTEWMNDPIQGPPQD